MGALRDSGRLLTAGVLAAACFLAVAARPGRADTVIMKSGVTYRSMGAPIETTRSSTFPTGSGIVVRDSRIERIEPNNASAGGEKFQLVQPLVVHGGLMPKDVVSVDAGPWDERTPQVQLYWLEAEPSGSNGAGDH